MSFLHNILARIQTKTDEIKEKKEFLDLVEAQAKPIRRAAYLEERKRAAVAEGIALAKAEAEKKHTKKKPEDFGMKLEDPYKYIDSTKSEEEK